MKKSKHINLNIYRERKNPNEIFAVFVKSNDLILVHFVSVCIVGVVFYSFFFGYLHGFFIDNVDQFYYYIFFFFFSMLVFVCCFFCISFLFLFNKLPDALFVFYYFFPARAPSLSLTSYIFYLYSSICI